MIIIITILLIGLITIIIVATGLFERPKKPQKKDE